MESVLLGLERSCFMYVSVFNGRFGSCRYKVDTKSTLVSIFKY